MGVCRILIPTGSLPVECWRAGWCWGHWPHGSVPVVEPSGPGFVPHWALMRGEPASEEVGQCWHVVWWREFAGEKQTSADRMGQRWTERVTGLGEMKARQEIKRRGYSEFMQGTFQTAQPNRYRQLGQKVREITVPYSNVDKCIVPIWFIRKSCKIQKRGGWDRGWPDVLGRMNFSPAHCIHKY